MASLSSKNAQATTLHLDKGSSGKTLQTWHLGLEEKDLLVIKSILNSSGSFFSNFEFKEAKEPHESDLLMINATDKKSSAQWFVIKENKPDIKAIMIVESSSQADELKNLKENSDNVVFIKKPIQARDLKKAYDLIKQNKGGMIMDSVLASRVESAIDKPIRSSAGLKENLNILIVDDSAPARQFMEIKVKELMGQENFTLDVAKDGEEALSKFDSKHIDLIFLDVEMPGMSGLEVCKKIRGLSETIRIVMLTGKSLSEDYVNGRNAGCNHYLTKPPADGDIRTILTLSVLKKKTAKN